MTLACRLIRNQQEKVRPPGGGKGLGAPDPVPPEMECSVLVPMTVDKVGVNRQLEIVKYCRSVGCMPTPYCWAVIPSSSILLQRQYAILGHRFQEQKTAGAGVILREDESSLETRKGGEHSRADTVGKKAALVLHGYTLCSSTLDREISTA